MCVWREVLKKCYWEYFLFVLLPIKIGASATMTLTVLGSRGAIKTPNQPKIAFQYPIVLKINIMGPVGLEACVVCTPGKLGSQL